MNAYLGGRVAASVKEAVCNGTVWAIRHEAAKPGSFLWIKGGNRQARLRVNEEVAAQ
jgi:NADH dehydrogenase